MILRDPSRRSGEWGDDHLSVPGFDLNAVAEENEALGVGPGLELCFKTVRYLHEREGQTHGSGRRDARRARDGVSLASASSLPKPCGRAVAGSEPRPAINEAR